MAQTRNKPPKSFRLSPRTIQLIDKLAALHDTTQTAIIEQAVREKARRDKVEAQAKLEEGQGSADD